jgi:hypothetical protein
MQCFIVFDMFRLTFAFDCQHDLHSALFPPPFALCGMGYCCMDISADFLGNNILCAD